MMNACVYKRYGSADELRVERVSVPIPQEDEVLIKIQRASINAWDWDRLCGTAFGRIDGGLCAPKDTILGADVAGVVEEVGGKVTRFKRGDEVCGDLSSSGWGGFAEYASAAEEAIALKVPALSFDEAAALPQAGTLALQGLRDKRSIARGERVLINGAGGGVGTFAIQIARHFGAKVTAVDKKEKAELMRELGAEETIDYRDEDGLDRGARYDCILNVVADRSIIAYRRALAKNGACIFIGGGIGQILQAVLIAPLLSLGSSKKIGVLAYRARSSVSRLCRSYARQADCDR